MISQNRTMWCTTPTTSSTVNCVH